VPERSGDHASRRLDPGSAVASADRRRGALHVADRLGDGVVVHMPDRRPNLWITIPKTTPTLFGAEKVRSNPATRTVLDELRNGVPSYGSSPPRTWRRSSPSTGPERPSCAAPEPAHLSAWPADSLPIESTADG
jgi:hypothetical protein